MTQRAWPPRRSSVRYALLAAAPLVLLAGGAFAALETDAVSSYGEGVWWAISLMTTAGFAGHAPTTTGGRALSAVLMVLGVGLIMLTTAAVASLFVEEEEAPLEARSREFEEEALAELRDLRARLERLERRRD